MQRYKRNNKHRIFSLPSYRFQVSLFSIWNNTTCFGVTIVTNSNFKFSNPQISRILSSRYRSLPVDICRYHAYFRELLFPFDYQYTFFAQNSHILEEELEYLFCTERNLYTKIFQASSSTSNYSRYLQNSRLTP